MQVFDVAILGAGAAGLTCAHVAAHAILAALWQRERTGQGAFVEIPMFESMVGFNLVEHYYGQHFEPPLSAPGYPRVLAPWRRPYRTADGAVAMMPYTNLHWQRFFTEVGAPELARDARFVDLPLGSLAPDELDRARGVAKAAFHGRLEALGCGLLDGAVLDRCHGDPRAQHLPV